jgi:hypothetical protein
MRNPPPLGLREAYLARKARITTAGSWPAMTHPFVGCMACQSDWQVYGIEIELV